MARCTHCNSDEVVLIGPAEQGEAVILACTNPACRTTFLEDLTEVLRMVREHQGTFPSARGTAPVLQLVPADGGNGGAFSGWPPPDCAA